MTNLLFHLHIPKTGGTSLLDLLNRNYKVQRLSNTEGWKRFEREEDATCISGHVPYKSIEVGNADYITVMRHPVDRIMSFYYYVRLRGPRNGWYKHIKDMSLAQFFISGVIDNECVRMLSGMKRRDVRINKKHLAKAKKNLSKFKYVALTKTISEDCERMAEMFSWEHRDVPHRLKSGNKGRDSLNLRDRLNATDAVGFDIELYKHAQRLRRDTRFFTK